MQGFLFKVFLMAIGLVLLQWFQFSSTLWGCSNVALRRTQSKLRRRRRKQRRMQKMPKEKGSKLLLQIAGRKLMRCFHHWKQGLDSEEDVLRLREGIHLSGNIPLWGEPEPQEVCRGTSKSLKRASICPNHSFVIISTVYISRLIILYYGLRYQYVTWTTIQVMGICSTKVTCAPEILPAQWM